MPEHKHTPAPWLLEGRTVYALNADGFNRFCAQVQGAQTTPAELEANARLICAAPDLLQALEDCTALLSCYKEEHEQCMRDARAAIARATGQA
ncbi:hypothetical protein ACFSHR_27185 [Azotobacter chroococcum]